jgi:hypothetical protein
MPNDQHATHATRHPSGAQRVNLSSRSSVGFANSVTIRVSNSLEPDRPTQTLIAQDS